MKLLIDAGNSRLKWAYLTGEALHHHGSCAHAELAGVLGILDELPVPDGVYCASVTDEALLKQLTQQVQRHWGIAMQRLYTTAHCAGVVNGYHQPERLGVDRWAALIGARQMSHAPLCVVDCGSAITVDAMDGAGHHLGGYIVPGLHMQQTFLQKGTAGIRPDDDDGSDGLWGQDTVSCIRRGTLEAVVGLIQRSRRQLQDLHGDEATVFVTGGDAPAVIPLLDFSVCHEADLVLAGMVWMVRELGE